MNFLEDQGITDVMAPNCDLIIAMFFHNSESYAVKTVEAMLGCISNIPEKYKVGLVLVNYDSTDKTEKILKACFKVLNSYDEIRIKGKLVVYSDPYKDPDAAPSSTPLTLQIPSHKIISVLTFNSPNVSNNIRGCFIDWLFSKIVINPRYVFLMDGSDYLHPDALKAGLEYLDNYPVDALALTRVDQMCDESLPELATKGYSGEEYLRYLAQSQDRTEDNITGFHKWKVLVKSSFGLDEYQRSQEIGEVPQLSVPSPVWDDDDYLFWMLNFKKYRWIVKTNLPYYCATNSELAPSGLTLTSFGSAEQGSRGELPDYLYNVRCLIEAETPLDIKLAYIHTVIDGIGSCFRKAPITSITLTYYQALMDRMIEAIHLIITDAEVQQSITLEFQA